MGGGSALVLYVVVRVPATRAQRGRAARRPSGLCGGEVTAAPGAKRAHIAAATKPAPKAAPRSNVALCHSLPLSELLSEAMPKQAAGAAARSEAPLGRAPAADAPPSTAACRPADIKDDEAALLAVCGSESMVDRVKALWEDIMEKKRLDVSNQGLNDDAVARLLKGLHMCASATSASGATTARASGRSIGGKDGRGSRSHTQS